MYCLNKIYQAGLQGRSSESFRFTIKDFKKVHGAFCTGGTNLSLAFDNGKNLKLNGFEFMSAMDVPPNKRPVLFKEPIETDLISGVVTGTPGQKASVYLILEK